MYSDGDDPKGPGFPIRISTDQSSFAAPHGFSQRTTSFIASRCQGIHQTPLRHLIDPTSNGQRPHRLAATRPRPRRQDLVSIIVTQSALPNDPTIRNIRSTPYDEYAEPSSGPGSPGHHALHHVQQPARDCTRAYPRQAYARQGNLCFLDRASHPRSEDRSVCCKEMVGQGRLELPTSRLSSARSNQLSYWPVHAHPPRHPWSGMVEADGFEPTTYGLQSRRSPS